MFFGAGHPRRHFSWGQRWCSGWCLEGGRKSGWLFWVKVVVSKPVLQRTPTFPGASMTAGAFSDGTFNADVRARVLVGQAQGCEDYHMSCGGRSGARLDGRLSILKEVCGERAGSVSEQTALEPDRTGIGTGSEPDRNRVGTGSEPDRNLIGNVVLHRWPMASKMLTRRYSGTGATPGIGAYKHYRRPFSIIFTEFLNPGDK